jgi:heme-degrading monooxygenase HmoA
VILEQAIFPIKPGGAETFAAAFARARKFIEAAPGFHKLEMRRGIETPDIFLLLVWWDSVEAHMEGFRQSEGFAQWRSLLGPHFAATPQVQHFEQTL